MKTSIYILVGFLFLTVPYGCWAQEKIRIGIGAVSLHSVLPFIGRQRGVFAKYNVDPEIIYIPGGSINVQAVISGNLDLSQLSGAPGAAANIEGADLIYILGLLDKLNYQLITRPEVKTVEQIKGTKLGISRFGSAADFGLRAVLKKIGVDPVKDVTILQIGDEPSRLAAVRAGNIDGTVMNAPFGAEAEKLQLRVLADSMKMGIPFFNTGLLGSRKFLDQHEARVLNFLRGYLEAVKIFKTEKEYAVKAVAQFTRVSNLNAVEEGYDYFNVQLRNVPYPSVEAMQAVVAQLAESNPRAKKVDAKGFVQDRYLRRLEEEGFVKKLWADR